MVAEHRRPVNAEIFKNPCQLIHSFFVERACDIVAAENYEVGFFFGDVIDKISYCQY